MKTKSITPAERWEGLALHSEAARMALMANQAKANVARFEERISKKYKLGDKDGINLDTGEIVPAPVEPPAE